MKRIRTLALTTTAALVLLVSSMALADAQAGGDDGPELIRRGGGAGIHFKK